MESFLLFILGLPRLLRESILAYFDKAKAVELAGIDANKELGLAAIALERDTRLALIERGVYPPQVLPVPSQLVPLTSQPITNGLNGADDCQRALAHG